MADIIKGNNSPNFVITAKGFLFSDSNWEANLYVMSGATAALGPLPMIKNTNNPQFALQLTPTQTATLAVQGYTAVIVVKNDPLNFKQEKSTLITVKASLIA